MARKKERTMEDIAKEFAELNKGQEPYELEHIDVAPWGKVLWGFCSKITMGIFLVWSMGYCIREMERTPKKPLEPIYKGYDTSRHPAEVVWWDDETMTAHYYEEVGVPNPRDWVQHHTRRPYGSHHQSSGVELNLGRGVYLSTGLDETEIIDQIAEQSDIYSLTDYFDEWVGD